jgi:hypothetical protein
MEKEYPERLFEKEIIAVRDQGFGCTMPYTTPIEKSRAAADYLISHMKQPLDFDKFHKEFQITMDKGGMLYPQDTLNWHTYLWLDHLGYDYKLFCLETKYWERQSRPRYILADRKENIVWGSDLEKNHRAFHNEFFPRHYNGAYYNANFELVNIEDEETNEKSKEEKQAQSEIELWKIIKTFDKKTIEEIIKLIESEEYQIVDNGIIISDEEGIVLTLKEILRGKNENYEAI